MLLLLVQSSQFEIKTVQLVVPFRVCARTNKWLLLLSFGQPAAVLKIKLWKLVPFRQ
jgi:hypothetical protein